MNNNSFAREELRTFAAFQKGHQKQNAGKYCGFIAVKSTETHESKVTGYGSPSEIISLNLDSIKKTLDSMKGSQKNQCIFKIFEQLGIQIDISESGFPADGKLYRIPEFKVPIEIDENEYDEDDFDDYDEDDFDDYDEGDFDDDYDDDFEADSRDLEE